MRSVLLDFLDQETGAVTVDWVVLAGAAVALGLGVLILIEPGVDNGAEKIANSISSAIPQSGETSETPEDL